MKEPMFKFSVPLAAQSFTAIKTYSEEEVKQYKAFLSMLENDELCGFVCFTPDQIRLIVDSGATACISNSLSDFTGPPRAVQPTTLSGIGGGLKVKGIGTARYKLAGNIELLIEDMLYVPDCPSRLLCPQQLLEQLNIGFHIDKDEDNINACWLSIPIGSESVKFPLHLNPRTNLPMLSTAPGISSCSDSNDSFDFTHKLAAFTGTAFETDGKPSAKSNRGVTSTQETSKKLSARETLLLQWHERLGHVGMEQIQFWARQGLLPGELLKSGPLPKCRTCLEAQSKKRAAGTSPIRKQTELEVQPGEIASVDQLVSPCDGLLLTTRGAPTKQRYRYVTFFVDHATRYIFPWFHSTNNVHDTIKAKEQYEAFSHTHNRTLCHIHGDNGTFSAAEFRSDALKKGQTQSFCATGAHWQNGIVERTIGIVTTLARSMLSHAMRQWPEMINEEFWPFAVRQAVNILNMLPRTKHQVSNHQKFTGERPPIKPTDFHVFGCPSYVLDEKLQNNKGGLSKWANRSRLGVYVGHSNAHAGNVLLIYNPQSTHSSPQYHCILDDGFSSIADLSPSPDKSADLKEYSWEPAQYSAENGVTPYHYTFDSFWDIDNQSLSTGRKILKVRKPTKQPTDSLPDSVVNNEQTSSEQAWSDDATGTNSNQIRGDVRRSSFSEGASAHQEEQHSTTLPQSHRMDARANFAEFKSQPKTAALYKRKFSGFTSNDDSNPPFDFASSKRQKGIDGAVISFPKFHRQPSEPRKEYETRISAAYLSAAEDIFADTSQFLQTDAANANIDPHCFTSELGNADTLTRSKMLRADDKDDFLKAEVKEVEGLTKLGVYELVQRRSLSPSTQYLHSVWSYRRKRHVDGTLLKHKARLCADGSREKKGVHFDEVFAPVVSWSTVRLLLFLSNTTKLASRQIDFVQAFTQAAPDRDIYMEVPAGWTVDSPAAQSSRPTLRQAKEGERTNKEFVMKLKRNLYGTRGGARAWWLHLRKGLMKRQFVQSETEPCLFIRKDCILICYTDDCCLFGPNQKALDNVIADLRKEFVLEDEGEIKDFLGVRVSNDRANGTITMTQEGLIQSVLQQVGLPVDDDKRKVQPKFTPAIGILHADTIGEERQQHWNYRSVIGKLMFIANNTRPDIAFAVHQAARYSTNPKKSHEIAVKHICRYLWLTQNKGLVCRPNGDGELNAYCDSDFAGRWHESTTHLRESVLSRTGYVLMFCGCPILWASKLQTEIALSSTEAELYALSSCMRVILPMRRVFKEISRLSFITNLTLNGSKILSHALKPTKVYEDNQSCIIVATSDHIKPRTRHLATKYFRFKDEVQAGRIQVVKVHTKDNVSDIFTKPLVKDVFEHLRRLLMGW